MKKLPKRHKPEEKSEKQFLWLSLIGADREEEIEMLATKSPVMEKAVGVLKKLSSDERARLLYESREKARRDELARLHGARTEGEAVGLAKGKREMAKQMLARGMDIGVVSELTGLSEDEIYAK
jgi:predicted transposase/invertase (TIGR01784 family)